MKIFNKKTNETGKFSMNFPRAIGEFEKAFQKFPIKKILYNRIFRGRGLEFDSYRVFEPDDDASLIDWKATLRANEMLVKKYLEEKDLNIYFILDASNGMLFGSGEKLKAEFSSEMIAAMAHLIMSSGDKVGLVIFNKKTIKFVPPSGGRNQFALLTKSLNEPAFYSRGFNLEEVINDAIRRAKTDYNVFILVSDFVNLKKEDEKILGILSLRFETIAIIVRDPLDDDISKVPLQMAVQDPETGRQMVLNPKTTFKKYKENAALQKEMVRNIFQKTNIDFVEMSSDKSFVNPLLSFIKRRARGGRV